MQVCPRYPHSNKTKKNQKQKKNLSNPLKSATTPFFFHKNFKIEKKKKQTRTLYINIIDSELISDVRAKNNTHIKFAFATKTRRKNNPNKLHMYPKPNRQFAIFFSPRGTIFFFLWLPVYKFINQNLERDTKLTRLFGLVRSFSKQQPKKEAFEKNRRKI